MPNVRTTCPTTKQLSDYGQGKLSAPDLSAIHEHLECCPQCRQKVVEQPPDSFVGQLRAAAPQTSDIVLPRRAPLPATSLADLPPELAASTKFEVLSKLGEGGMGAVYKARHTFLNELVAIKVMNATALANPEARGRFLREMQAVGQLKHKNIVRALDAEQMGELLVLVMEYVEGITLDRLVAQKGILPVAYSCHCIARACLGLQYAHEKEMVHRDVKPANLIVATKEKEVKLLDFGLARGTCGQKAKNNHTQIGVPMGTPAYMAPEQVTDASSADIRADVYSLGCTLYYLLAGQSPFQRDSAMTTMMAQVSDEARPLPEVRPDVPVELWTVVAKMLAKKPEERHQTPKEVEQALRPFVTGGANAGQAVEGTAKAKMHAAATMLPGNTSKLRPVSSPSRLPQSAAPAEKTSPSILPASGPAAGRGRRKKAKEKKPWLAWKVWVAGVAACLMVAVLVGAVVLILKTRGGDKVVVEIDQADKGKGETVRVRIEQPQNNPPADPAKPPPPAGVVADDPVKVAKDKPVSKADGYEVLFTGKDLKGWVVDSGDKNAWRVNVESGELIGRGPEKDHMNNVGYLLTDRDFTDFRLRFQFQQGNNATVLSGIVLRAVLHETARDSDPNWESDWLFHLTVALGKYLGKEETGSLVWSPNPKIQHWLIPEQLAEVNRIGKWNDVVVEMRGQSLRIAVNGHEVQNVKLNQQAAAIKNPAPGLKRFSGRIGFLKRTGEVRFRKIEIKELSEAAAK